jgi:predicted nucleotidyltransferase
MTIDTTSLKPISERYSLGFLAVFGSSARGKVGRDLDVAVMPANPIEDMRDREQLFEDLSEALYPAQVDLTYLPNASWLLAWHVARDGICLLGNEAFARFQVSSFWRKTDSGGWRWAEKSYLARFLRKEKNMDGDLIQRRLLQMSQYLSELEMVLAYPQREFESKSTAIAHR